MATLQLAWNNAAITQFGNTLTGTVMNTGFRVSPASQHSYYDVFFTNADTVQLNGGMYLTFTGQCIATLRDTSGTVLQTQDIFSIGGFSSGSTSVQTLTIFSSLTPGTTYWLRYDLAGAGGQIIQSDALVQLANASGTPTVSAVTGWDPARTYQFGTALTGPIQIGSKVGMEGNGLITTIIGSTVYSSGGSRSGSILRFKANCTSIWVKLYGAAACGLHLQSVALNGSSGTPTSIASITNSGSHTYFEEWQLLASGLSAVDTLYEVYASCGSGGGVLMEGMMVVGGTGVDTTTTTAGLTRTKQLGFIGDSRVQQNLPSNTTGTFTYTAASTGAKTISVTNNGSLSNPSNIIFTASAAAMTTAAYLIGIGVEPSKAKILAAGSYTVPGLIGATLHPEVVRLLASGAATRNKLIGLGVKPELAYQLASS